MPRIVGDKGTVDIRIPLTEQDKYREYFTEESFVNHFFKGEGAGDGGRNGEGEGGDNGNGKGGNGGDGGCQCEDCCPELTEQVLEAVSERVDDHVTSALDTSMAEASAKLENEFLIILSQAKDKVSGELADLEERIKKHKRVEVSLNGGAFKPIEEHTHVQFQDLLKLIATKNPVLMVGPAGSGKTHAAMQVARSLELPFYANSVCAQTSESKLLGYMNANGGYVTTEFRKAFENGGIYLMDEIDAGNPNVIVVMNAALSSNMCAFPDGMVKKHENFLFIAAANTFGTGADRQYVGRNQLDLATLDRFIMIEWIYDLLLEEQLVSHHKFSTEWLLIIYRMRELIQQNAYRLIVSPRATIQGAQLLAQGFDIETVMKLRVLPTATVDQQKFLLGEAKKLYGALNVSISRAS